VSIEWQRPPESADEMEILLVLDDSAETTLRLTRQLSPSTSSYLWQVPNLPGSRARLVLRFGEDGREQECEPSEPFAIVTSAEEPLAPISFSDGEWWLGNRFGLPTSCGVTGGRTSISQPTGARAAAVLPSVDSGSGDQQRRDCQADCRQRNRAPRQTASRHLARCPLTFPLRP
jgi:hypothetical protein